MPDSPSWLRGDWAGTWWARLRANAQARRAGSKLGLGLSGENHSTKTNFTTEPIAAPPTLCFLC
ncbi:hypothetical protein [Lacticaseibacillus paracasei]|uniref:hypothetical protein n=1 Tax=Lacticaseibacillus paracasei TaxID=1597 RepID=UPI002B4B3E50|nr:hypothetical protein [Lacticaseibacillus paracasei]